MTASRPAEIKSGCYVCSECRHWVAYKQMLYLDDAWADGLLYHPNRDHPSEVCGPLLPVCLDLYERDADDTLEARSA